MSEDFSPKQLAEALGVSESSIKRWVDQGRLAATRTAGGHRRIRRTEAVRFVREGGLPVARPDLLGFGEVAFSDPSAAAAKAADRLYAALVEDREGLAAGIIHGRFLDGAPLATLFDELIAPPLHRVGELWRHNRRGIFLEHRAMDFCLRAVVRLRDSIASADPPRGSAVGGSGPKDVYSLPTLMAATLLREQGWRETNIGADTPLTVLAEAAEMTGAKLAWLSFSTVESAMEARAELEATAERLSRGGCRLIVGGREHRILRDIEHPNLHFGESMGELATFAAGIASGA
jgi:excisionase family DNA binding protein